MELRRFLRGSLWSLRGAGCVRAFFFSGLALLSTPSLFARDQIVEMFAGVFLPQLVSVEIGDTITWRRIDGEHTVTSGVPGGLPGTIQEPGALFDVVLDASNPTFTYTVEQPFSGGITYFDRSLPGQIGFVSITGGEVEVRVAVVDNVFDPEVVWIFAGDSIKWEHEPMEAFHTVTSGRSSAPEDNPGELFDEESSDERPLFVYEFTSPGEYPYFCRPHQQLDMVGTIWVQQTFIRGDATGDGELDISDAVATLSFLFLGD